MYPPVMHSGIYQYKLGLGIGKGKKSSMPPTELSGTLAEKSPKVINSLIFA